MNRSAKDYVESYAAEMDGVEPDLGRVVTTPSGLDAPGMTEALTDPWFAEAGRQPVALQMLCDWMDPDRSVYFDAIFGDFRGQHAIRNWLIPAMSEIDFIEFAPTAPGAHFDDGMGGSSVDEWQMFANLDGVRLPLSRGVSVRRYRDGWIAWNCDVYDTGPFRVPPPPDAGVEAAPIPDWPRTTWDRDPEHLEIHAPSVDWASVAEAFHPTDSVLHDPVAGELRGRDAIAAWFSNVMSRAGDVVFEPLGPRLRNESTTVQEWQQMAVQPDGSRVFMTRGTSVRRREQGMVTYAAEYYDTASLGDDEIRAAARAAGSTIDLDDLRA